MEFLWLISQGFVYRDLARLAGVSAPTVDHHVAVYREGVQEAFCG